MQCAKYGKKPSGDRLERIQSSLNFKDGEFVNSTFTPVMTGGGSTYKSLKDYLFNQSDKAMPPVALPSKKIDLHALNVNEDILVWFGHSSYFMQIGGKRFLIDPVFSGNASPVTFTTKSYTGSDIYCTDDMPEIDYLLISHDHWDHLDYQTVINLKPKIKQVVTGLGTGSHLEYWGYDKERIIEKDWYQNAVQNNDVSITVTPARHFSGRLFSRNKTLWASFVIKTPNKTVFFSGDTGYDTHFKTIGEKYGPFDIAVLDCGQYNQYWSAIHMLPEETVQASIDLDAQQMFPGHWSKFTLALHDWDEPIRRVVAEGKKLNISLIHPLIGEPVPLNKQTDYSNWWEKIK